MEYTDIRSWVESNAAFFMPNEKFSSEELDHIAKCLHHIYLWYHEDYPIGHFLTAVVHNDFSTACIRADDINIRALVLYAQFLGNKIPFNYRDKAEGR